MIPILQLEFDWPVSRRAGDLKKIFCSFASFGGRQVWCSTTDAVLVEPEGPERGRHDHVHVASRRLPVVCCGLPERGILSSMHGLA